MADAVYLSLALLLVALAAGYLHVWRLVKQARAERRAREAQSLGPQADSIRAEDAGPCPVGHDGAPGDAR